MKGDSIYCFNCKRLSKDIDRVSIQDSRVHENFLNRCPYCGASYTINATKIFLEAKEIKKRFKNALTNWNKRSLYYMLLTKQKALNSGKTHI